MAHSTAHLLPKGLLRWAGWAIALFILIALKSAAHAHGVGEDDRAFIEGASGMAIGPYMYLGAKHMVTGYDHLLFLVGVIFFLYRLRDVGAYVTLFAIGHSTTLLLGVLFDIRANPNIVDAIIGLSVVYKAFDNLDGFRTVFGRVPNPKAAVLIFGFFHGFGLATKLQDLTLSKDGLLANLISFKVGVELGQFTALGAILIAMNLWRSTSSFRRSAITANAALMCAGFVLVGFQLPATSLRPDKVSTMIQTDVASPVGSMQVSPGTLGKATGGALLAAAAIVVMFVLPAKYGIDPTGVGRLTRIDGMAAGKNEAAPPADAPIAGPAVAVMPTKATITRDGELHSDEMTLTLAPHSGQEVKAHMKAGDRYVFEWSSKGGPVKADMHGEKVNAAEGKFTSYWEEKVMTGGKGNFTAPVDGTHGWYFRNKVETPVTVKVHTNGFYKDLFLPQG